MTTKEKILTLIQDINYAYNDCTMYETIKNLLDKMAEEREKGKWEMKPDPYGFFEEIPVCSECGCTTKLREKYPYCPNCGANMREEQADEGD